MKIAILHCRKASDVCTGAACFKAYHQNLKSFAQYRDNQPELAAFFDCGGCGIDRAANPGMVEKMQRLKSEGVDKIHIGICVNPQKCSHYQEILALLDQYEIPYELGTH